MRTNRRRRCPGLHSNKQAEEVIALTSEICMNYRLIADYKQRPKMNDMFKLRINSKIGNTWAFVALTTEKSGLLYPEVEAPRGRRRLVCPWLPKTWVFERRSIYRSPGSSVLPTDELSEHALVAMPQISHPGDST